MPSGLPIDAILPELLSTLRTQSSAVVNAPPGAGKTTIVPLELMDEPWAGDRVILMLEPRRIAARAAAHRMASLRGETVGRTIGIRTRLDTRVSGSTRIEVVTEGVLTRLVQEDPALERYAAVIFDEFHERNLNADAGLALVLHSRRLVRPDLRVIAMSATIDGTAVSRLLDQAPVITSPGRQFEVAVRYRGLPGTIPRHPDDVARRTAAVLREALEGEFGDVLVFLPGTPEIRRTASLLEGLSLPDSTDVIPLHGMLHARDQDRAILPSPPGRRKIVLATAIAETSLTIDGVRIVVDSGLARRPRFSPRTGMSRLETARVSHATAEQRRGRAGRTESGVCYRLWTEEDQGALSPFQPPEILDADLAPLVLDFAVAGIRDHTELDWLDLPPSAAWKQAVQLLSQLDALDENGRVTPHGRAMAGLGMHPRLAHMVLLAREYGHGALACDVAALLSERDPVRAVGTDLRVRLNALQGDRPVGDADLRSLERIREQARRWRTTLRVANEPRDESAIGMIVARAFPDRVAVRRPGQTSRYLLRNGTGAILPEGDSLSLEPWLVVVESDGRVPESRIFLAATIDRSDVEEDFAAQMETVELVTWVPERGIHSRIERRLGAIVLESRPNPTPDPILVADAIAGYVRSHGLDILPWDEADVALRQRLAFLHHHLDGWPDVSDDALVSSLLPHLIDALKTVRNVEKIDVSAALVALLTWQQRVDLDRLAPAAFLAPTGTSARIDYADPDAPTVSIRLQELFGCNTTPTILGGRVPLTLQLLSPARRPVQVTRDLAGFWRSSYFDVRRDLRARYPRHPWPDDPASAEPTTRTKRRG